jgi:hypothetical protein
MPAPSLALTDYGAAYLAVMRAVVVLRVIAGSGGSAS